jgi:hypothetical protein
MTERFQVVVGGVLTVLCGLSALSHRFPRVGWLQHFRIRHPQLTDQQRARMGRRAAVYAGAQLILFGVALPIGYLALTVMTFSAITTRALTLVLGGSALCTVLGIAGIVKGGRR